MCARTGRGNLASRHLNKQLRLEVAQTAVPRVS